MEDQLIHDIINKDIFSFFDLKEGENYHRERILNDLLNQINFGVVDRLKSSLSEEEFEEWSGLVALNDENKLRGFYNNHKIDMDKIMEEEAFRVKTEVIMFAKYKKEAKKMAEKVIKSKKWQD